MQISHNNTLSDDEKIASFVDTLIIAKDKMHFSTEIIMKLLNVFLISSVESAEKILQAIPPKDLNEIEMNAHAIRGGALALDLEKISTLCHGLEYGHAQKETDYLLLAEALYFEVNYLLTHKEEIFKALIAIG